MLCQEFVKDVEKEWAEEKEKGVKDFLRKMLGDIEKREKFLVRRKKQYQIYLDMTVDELYSREYE